MRPYKVNPMWLPSIKFFAPENVNTGGVMNGPVPEMSVSAIFDTLSEGAKDEEIIDLTPQDKKVEKEKVDDTEGKVESKEDDEEKVEIIEEEDELAELEKELQGPTDEQLELMPAPRRKEILAAFPELFKKFPYLEKAYYRDQQYTELLPTIPDAKEAVEKSKAFDAINKRIEDGDIKSVLEVINKKDKNTFHSVVDNYLTSLNEVDPSAYLHVIGNVAKHITIQMVNEAKRINNEDLHKAAILMHQYAFGNSEFTPPQTLARPKEQTNEKETDLDRREKEFNQRRYNEAQNDLSTKVNNSIKATIDKHIDPKQSMTDYVKRAAINDALANVNKFISQDTRFATIIDKLWEDSARRGFDKASVDKIRMACISKAQTLLPTVIKSARNEALKGLGKRQIEEKEETNDEKETPEKRERSTSSNKSSKGKVPEGMTTREYLMADD